MVVLKAVQTVHSKVGQKGRQLADLKDLQWVDQTALQKADRMARTMADQKVVLKVEH